VTVGEARATRTLALLILLGIANHTVLSGSRVIVSLDALSMGASPFTVGVLMSLYALLPMLLSVAAGRVSDRIGTRWPMRVGSALIAIGAILPVAFPGFPALFASAPLVGLGFMAFQLAAQTATGEFGGLARRSRNFTLLALGFSVSGFIGPLAAGFTIDHFGFRAAFALFAVVPLIPMAVLANRRFELPARAPQKRRGAARWRAGAAAPPDAAPGVCGECAARDGLGSALDLRADLR
jgi:MFS family permease